MNVQKAVKHADFHGVRLFGEDRWKYMRKAGKSSALDESINAMAFEALHSSGFEDDAEDDVRTRSNMELAILVYTRERMGNFDNWPIYIEDGKKPSCYVGVEQAFDVVLEYADGALFRYAGTIDGCVVKKSSGKLFLEENKTAARLDVGWRAAFDMSHQVTGYNFCSSVFFGKPVMDTRVTGLKVKPTNKGEDIWVAELKRDSFALVHWGAYARRMIDTFETYKDDYENAARYTHSCNRFFRPCSLLTFCADTPKGRQEQWAQMVASDRSPTERAVLEDL